MQSVYSTVPADWALGLKRKVSNMPYCFNIGFILWTWFVVSAVLIKTSGQPFFFFFKYKHMGMTKIQHDHRNGDQKPWIKWVLTCSSCTILYYHHHHHHIALVARISLTLSRHSSQSFIALGRSSGQHPVSSHSCWMYVRAGRSAFARPCVGVHKSTSLMSSSLLLQQCPACLARLFGLWSKVKWTS